MQEHMIQVMSDAIYGNTMVDFDHRREIALRKSLAFVKCFFINAML